MLNGVAREERLERTISGVLSQIEDFEFIIVEHIEKMSEKEMMGLYELEEDLGY